ncbi:MAG: hypothetical protein HDR39_00405 [Treponema sp.]|nr:hypothetical protein [Treponema sp.]
MQWVGNWKTWESKDKKVRRIYVGGIDYLYEGATGLCCQSGGFLQEDIEYVNKYVGQRTFDEVFAEVSGIAAEKRRVARLIAKIKKEKKARLATVKTEEDRLAVIDWEIEAIKKAKIA